MASVISNVPVGEAIKRCSLHVSGEDAPHRPWDEAFWGGPGCGAPGRPAVAHAALGHGQGRLRGGSVQSIIEDSRPWRGDGRRFPSDAVLLAPAEPDQRRTGASIGTPRGPLTVPGGAPIDWGTGSRGHGGAPGDAGHQGTREYEFLREQVRATGCATLLVDVGIVGDPQAVPDITADEVARGRGERPRPRGRRRPGRGRGGHVSRRRGSARAPYAAGNLHGVLGMGGSGARR